MGHALKAICPQPHLFLDGEGGCGGGGTLEVEASKYNTVYGNYASLQYIVKISLILLNHCQHLCDFIIPV